MHISVLYVKPFFLFILAVLRIGRRLHSGRDASCLYSAAARRSREERRHAGKNVCRQGTDRKGELIWNCAVRL